MKADDAAERPTAEVTLLAWSVIHRDIDQAKYYLRLGKYSETMSEEMFNSSIHALKGGRRLVAS